MTVRQFWQVTHALVRFALATTGLWLGYQDLVTETTAAGMWLFVYGFWEYISFTRMAWTRASEFTDIHDASMSNFSRAFAGAMIWLRFIWALLGLSMYMDSVLVAAISCFTFVSFVFMGFIVQDPKTDPQQQVKTAAPVVAASAPTAPSSSSSPSSSGVYRVGILGV